MQSQLVGNYSEKLCLSFFPLICYLRQLWHDKRAWKGLEQQINVTDTKHLKLSFSLATSAHNPLDNLLIFYLSLFFLISMNFILIEFRLNLFYSCQFLATHCKFRTRCDASASFFMNHHQRYWLFCSRIWIGWRGCSHFFFKLWILLTYAKRGSDYPISCLDSSKSNFGRWVSIGKCNFWDNAYCGKWRFLKW